jgi:hypothetical protein
VAQPTRLLLVARAISSGNRPPVAVPDTFVVAEGTPVTLVPQANDTDPDADDLSLVRVVTTAALGRAYLAPDGSSLTYVPPSGAFTEDSLTYAVTDCEGATDSTTVVIRSAAATGTPPPATPPPVYLLHANVPNPFNPLTRIAYDVARPGPARVAVYDLRGRLVQVLADGYHEAGSYAVDWTGRDDGGRSVAAGVYVARLEAPGHVSARKLTLVR